MSGTLPPGAPQPPKRIGPYEIRGLLGEGGMGTVYLGARDDGADVAIKVVRADLHSDDALLDRFAREITAAEAVTGSHVSRVLDHGEQDGQRWVATEFIQGPTLDAHLRQAGFMSPEQAQWLAEHLLTALEQIHASGVVHRDITPSNIILGPDHPVIVDFGIARLASAQTITSAGQVMGTPAWMSPEQAQGRAVDASTDLFSVGAICLYAATGRAPFSADSDPATLYQVVHEEPDVGAAPVALQRFLSALLEKKPEDRPTPASARELLGKKPRRRPARMLVALAVLALAAVATVGALLALRNDTPLQLAGADTQSTATQDDRQEHDGNGTLDVASDAQSDQPTRTPTPAPTSAPPASLPPWEANTTPVTAPVDLQPVVDVLRSNGGHEFLGCDLFSPVALGELGWGHSDVLVTGIGSFEFGWQGTAGESFFIDIWHEDYTNGNVDRFFSSDAQLIDYQDGSWMRAVGDDRLIRMAGQPCYYELLLDGVSRVDLGWILTSWSPIHL